MGNKGGTHPMNRNPWNVLGSAVVAFSLAFAFEAAAAEPACNATPAPHTTSGVRPWLAGGAVGFTTKTLEVDADGAPGSYLVDGNGLSYTCDGVVALVDGVRQTAKNNKQHWQELCRDGWKQAQASGDYSQLAIFGFMATDKGPVVQKEGEPLPGKAFITTTSVAVPGTPEGTQRHFVDAVAIPYVVLPDSFVREHHIKPGSVAAVYWPAQHAFAFGVYGDGGDLGEASVRLHTDLGHDPMVIHGGVKRAKSDISSAVTTLVFPAVATHPTTDSAAWRAEIATLGNQALDAWGGKARLAACAR